MWLRDTAKRPYMKPCCWMSKVQSYDCREVTVRTSDLGCKLPFFGLGWVVTSNIANVVSWGLLIQSWWGRLLLFYFISLSGNYEFITDFLWWVFFIAYFIVHDSAVNVDFCNCCISLHSSKAFPVCRSPLMSFFEIYLYGISYME